MLQRIVITIVILAVVGLGGLFAAKNLMSSGHKDVNQYRVSVIKTDTVKKTVTATGILTAWKTIDIKSRAGGRVVSLPVEEGTRVTKGQLLARIDPSDTLLTYNSAKADIDSNKARVQETSKTLSLQEQQTLVAEQTAQANLDSAIASANAAKARYDSAKSQADAQKDLTDSAIESAQATLNAEQERLNQMKTASHPQSSALAEAALDEAKANLKNAEAQLTRQKKLLAQGFVAQAQVDQAQASYDVSRATVANAQTKMDTMKPELDTDLRAEEARVQQFKAALRTAEANRVQIRLREQDAAAANAQYQQAVAEIAQAKARVREARAGRYNIEIRRTQIAQAQAAGSRAGASLINAKVQLDETSVNAPSEGIVLKKYVEQGTLITSGISFNSTGTSIIQLGDVTRMYVDVQVDETDVANVEMDQKVDIMFDAYSTTPIEGKVIKIQPQAVVDQNVTTVHVRVEVDNSATMFRLLKPGMNATCEFIVAKKPDVVAVPNEALRSETDGSKYVEVAQGGKTAPAEKEAEADPNLLIDLKPVKKPVELGLEGNELTEVVNGLKEGDRVITQTIEPSTTPPGGGNPFGGSKGPGRR